MLALIAVVAMVSDGPPALPAAVTFAEQVSPILNEHCASCHSPGGGGPFDLQTYADARTRAALIARVTARRQMPPWKPEHGVGAFEGERRLTDAQIALIQEWVRQGAPEGDRRLTAAAPSSPGGWQLGPPDLVLTLPASYQLPADGPDVFRTFILPIRTDRLRTVRAFEFRAGTPSAVHHASIKFDRTRASRERDALDEAPGFDGGGGRSARFPDGHFLSWTPGVRARLSPDGMGWPLEPDADMVLELHLTPSGKPERVQPAIGVYFSSTAPSIAPFMLRLGSQTIDIAAGERQYSVTDAFVLPVDVDVLALQPHAHNLAREIRAFAQLPDGSTTPLLHIADWEVRWQDVYRCRTPVRLPAGTTLTMQFTYDNSSANPRNPNDPPRRVTFGQTTASEMGNLWVQVLTVRAEDRRVLDAAFLPKMMRDDLAGSEKAVEVSPRDPRLRVELALQYAEMDRADAAVSQLEEAVRLSPDSSPAHYALGTLLLTRRALDAARREMDVALRLNPQFAEAWINLGVISQAQGELSDARAHYEAALRLEPASVEARYNLARVNAAQGQFAEAIANAQRARALRPGDADILATLGSALAADGQSAAAIEPLRAALRINARHTAALVDLAWLLATGSGTAGDPGEAVRLAEQAARQTDDQNPIVLDTLAVAYFAAGRDEEARRTAERALALALANGADDLVSALRARLDQITRR